MADLIEGFMIGGSAQITVATTGHAIILTTKKAGAEVEMVLSHEQSERLRRLIRSAQRRAA